MTLETVAPIAICALTAFELFTLLLAVRSAKRRRFEVAYDMMWCVLMADVCCCWLDFSEPLVRALAEHYPVIHMCILGIIVLAAGHLSFDALKRYFR